jgi:hypothetical protein
VREVLLSAGSALCECWKAWRCERGDSRLGTEERSDMNETMKGCSEGSVVNRDSCLESKVISQK